MLIQEFIERTGEAIELRAYQETIEPAYYKSADSKDMFCYKWLLKQIRFNQESVTSMLDKQERGELSETEHFILDFMVAQIANFSKKLLELHEKMKEYGAL